MPVVKNKNSIFIAVAIILILGGVIYFYFFQSETPDTSVTPKKTDVAQEDESAATNTSAKSDASNPSSIIENLGEFSNLKGEELLALLNLLQTIKLDTSFFESENFKKQIDFYRVLEIRDEEKGNPNLFIEQ